jgi:hypothetical protein
VGDVVVILDDEHAGGAGIHAGEDKDGA